MSPGTKIFGTDGVRGRANVEPVTAETALKLGRAAAHVFKNLNPESRSREKHRIVIGKDADEEGVALVLKHQPDGLCRPARNPEVHKQTGKVVGKRLAHEVDHGPVLVLVLALALLLQLLNRLLARRTPLEQQRVVVRLWHRVDAVRDD